MFRQAPSFPYHDLGIVEDGNTASRAISKDAYVIWKGESYFASTDILQGATLEEDVNLTAIPDGVINGVVSALNNNFKWTCLLQPTTISNDSTAALSDNIENYNELFIQMYTYVSASTPYRRACVGVIPVAAIKAYGYDTNNQFIVSCIGSVNAEGSKLNYAEYTQFSFTNATTLKINFLEARGWSGSYYFTVYAR